MIAEGERKNKENLILILTQTFLLPGNVPTQNVFLRTVTLFNVLKYVTLAFMESQIGKK